MAATALLAAIGFTPGAPAIVGLVAFAPLLLVCRDLAPRAALLAGWAAGTLFLFATYRFLPRPLSEGAGLPLAGGVAATVGLAVLRGASVGLACLVGAWVRLRGGRGTLATAAGIAVFEALVPDPLPVPFGVSLLGWPVLAQIADVLGPWGTTLLTALSGAALAELARARTRSLDRVTLAVGCGAVMLAAGYGALRIAAIERAAIDAPRVVIELVQPAHTRNAARPVFTEELGHRPGVDLVVLPENVLARPVPAADFEPFARALVDGAGVPVLLGATERGTSGDRNVALLLEPDGHTSRYEKQRLIPFGERGYVAGDREHGAPLVMNGDVRVGVAICYDDLFTHDVRARIADAEVIVDIANDGWFTGTNEPGLHLAAAQLRAIETRRAVMRAANDGITASIDPAGRISARAPEGVPASIVATAPRMDVRSPYTRLGCAPFVALVATLFAFSLWKTGSLRRVRSSAPS